MKCMRFTLLTVLLLLGVLHVCAQDADSTVVKEEVKQKGKVEQTEQVDPTEQEAKTEPTEQEAEKTEQAVQNTDQDGQKVEPKEEDAGKETMSPQKEEAMRSIRVGDFVLTKKRSKHPGRWQILGLKNNSPKNVIVIFINEYEPNAKLASKLTLKKGETKKFDLTCNKINVMSEDEQDRIILFSEPMKQVPGSQPAPSKTPAKSTSTQPDDDEWKDFVPDDDSYSSSSEEDDANVETPVETISSHAPEEDSSGKIIATCVVLMLLAGALLLWYRRAKTQEKKRKEAKSSGAMNAAVHKTTAAMLKHSLEGAVGNNAYMVLDAQDFCGNSAIKQIYFKNVCMKELYKLYADIVQDPACQNEYGCLLVGRWVQEGERYNVSLEQLLLPGSDAVFTENELTFGSRTKMKITERLRKLRRDSNLYYDVVCWVHSHPGTGVSFSNSDGFVHTQLRHANHPKTLMAMVVDPLSQGMQFGFFTSKTDSTMNTRAELTKVYSLEEMYQWAVNSERQDIRRSDYYDSLQNAAMHTSECQTILLSNSAIIDMVLMMTEPAGLAGYVHGFAIKQGGQTEYVAATVTSEETEPGNETIGCFVIVSTSTLAAIHSLVAPLMNRIHFVLVYASGNKTLTSIPVASGSLCSIEGYFGNQVFKDLEIWTRRVR